MSTAVAPGLPGAHLRYRVMAYAVGIGLVVLVGVGIPLQVAGHPAVVRIVGPIHGFLFLVYLVAAADLTRRVRWPLAELLWMVLAGLVPFAAFVVEGRVSRRIERALHPG